MIADVEELKARIQAVVRTVTEDTLNNTSRTEIPLSESKSYQEERGHVEIC